MRLRRSIDVCGPAGAYGGEGRAAARRVRRREELRRPDAAERLHEMAVRPDEQHGVRGRTRVTLGDQELGLHREAVDRLDEPGHDPGPHPVPPVPDPGARRDEQHEQMPLPQPLPEPYGRSIGRGDPHIGDRRTGGVPTEVCASARGGARGEWE